MNVTEDHDGGLPLDHDRGELVGALTDKATARMLHDHNLGPATIAALGEIEMALHGPSPAAPCDRAKRT